MNQIARIAQSCSGDFLRGEAPSWVPEPSKAGKGWRASVITASEFKGKEFNPVRYVVPGYIAEGVTIFAGKPKIGKSWMLYDICLASAADRFVLGEIKPSQGDVLYLALEDSQRRLKKRLEKLWPVGSWPTQLTLATEWHKADAGGLRDLEDWCMSVANPLLIVVDTLEKFRPPVKPGTPPYTADYLAIEGLHKLAHSRGIAIVVIHHVRKMEADDPFDTVSGTNGLTGAADTILILKRQAGNVTLHARGRDCRQVCAENTRPRPSWRRERNWDPTFSMYICVVRRGTTQTDPSLSDQPPQPRDTV